MAIACALLAATGACDRIQTRQNSHATFEQLSERGRELCRDGHYIEGLTLLQAAAGRCRLAGDDASGQHKYRTTQLKRETAVLQAELRTRQQRIILISVIGLLVVAGLVVFLIMRSRNHKQKQQLTQQNIDTLLAERIALNTKIEELNRLQAESNAETKPFEALPAILLEKEDEKRFRKSFNDLHPGFIDNLRKTYPDLTSGDELLCMLIALRRRNEEIALALGISRDSVATSRYRLRTRFNLPKDVDLNDFIQSML